jgi:hypothetical protein
MIPLEYRDTKNDTNIGYLDNTVNLVDINALLAEVKKGHMYEPKPYKWTKPYNKHASRRRRNTRRRHTRRQRRNM